MITAERESCIYGYGGSMAYTEWDPYLFWDESTTIDMDAKVVNTKYGYAPEMNVIKLTTIEGKEELQKLMSWNAVREEYDHYYLEDNDTCTLWTLNIPCGMIFTVKNNHRTGIGRMISRLYILSRPMCLNRI